jgi:phosphoserine phosphatase
VPLIGQASAPLKPSARRCAGSDRLDGRLAGPNCRDEEKARILERLRQQHPGLPVIGYGNSGADVAHLIRCDEAIYVNAGRRSRKRLEKLGLRCVHWR